MSESHRSLFAKLVEPHFDGLYRTAMRLTRNADDAEDLVQEACLRAYAQLSSLERAERPAAWLQRVQYRIFIDDVRHRRRSPFAALSEPGNLLDITPSQQPNPEELADGALLERHLERAWRLLGKEQRALLALHAEGYSLSDLELITGAGRNAIGVRLHRARTKLARLLEARLERPGPCALGSPQNRSFAGALPSPIEVLYFFMYGCFPCYAFEPQIDGWETRADRVELVRVPVVFNRQAELHARAHYTAEALGKLDAMHDAFFTAIHDRGNRLDDEASIAALFAQLGVDDVDFRATFHSPEIDRKLEEAIDLTRSLGVDAVPSLVVGRRYLTSPSMAGSHEEAIEVAEALAESAVSDAQQCEPAVMREPRRQLETISQDGADTETLVELVERAATGCPSRNRIF